MDSFIKSIKRHIKPCDCYYECNANRFEQYFKDWTSGNSHIDKFIQSTQLSDHNHYWCQALEWIPYDRFYDIKYVMKSETGEVYKANWIDGYIDNWDESNQNWKRDKPNMSVFLKILNNPTNITSEFINEV
jgi:hypothetical protein